VAVRLLRALGVILALLLAATLAAAWLVPPRLDLNDYRGEIATLAAARLGGQVRIDGPVAFRLLPEPTLSAEQISLAGDGAGIAVTAAELRLRLALGPLLAGRVDARELVLRGADLHLPWPLPPSALMLRTPHWLAAFSARVEGGALHLGKLAFTGIDATLATEPYTGTYIAAGTAQLSGRPWQFTARVTQPGPDGAAGVDVTLDGHGPVQGTGGTLTGQIAPDGTLIGRVTGWGTNLSELLPAPAVAFRAEGRLTVGGGLAAADDLMLQIAGSPARGAVALRFTPKPRLDLALATGRLDLDAWLPVLLRPSAAELPIGIDFSAEAATLFGGTLRGLRGAVDLTPEATVLREARAMLPGDAALQLAGRIARAERGAPSRPRFEGDASLAAPALRTTLAWAEKAGLAPLAALPTGVLRNATLAGHVTVEPGLIALAKLVGTVDESQLTGSLTVREGKRLAIGAGLAVDRLALDPWLPDGPPHLAALPATFAGFDADLRLEAKEAVLHGVTLAPLSLDAGAEGGRLTVRKLDLAIEGVHAAGSVTVGEGGRVSEGRLDIQAPQAAPLAALLPERLAFLGHRAPRLWRAAAAVQVLGSGVPDQMALKITADLGDLRLEALPTFDLTHDTFKMAMTLRHPGAPRLLEAIGIEGAPSWLGDGSLGLVAQLSGAPGKLAVDNFDLAAGGLHATGALLFDDAVGPPTLTGRIAAETLPLPLPRPRSDEPLPLAALAGWNGQLRLSAEQVRVGPTTVLRQAQAALILDQGRLRLDDVSGALAGGRLAGSAVLDSTAEPPALTLGLDVAGASFTEPVFDLPLDLAAGRVEGSARLHAAGHAPAALLATLAGDIRLDVQNGLLAGVALQDAGAAKDEAAVRAALEGGSTPFTHMQIAAHVEHGVVTLAQATLDAAAGSATLGGTIDLPGAAADLSLAFQPSTAEAPTIGLRLTGPLDAIHRTPELAALTRWRAEHAPADPPTP
jgi:hypothetical protein